MKPKPMPTYADILVQLSRFTNYERVKDYRPGHDDLGTDRIELLLSLLGNPQKSLQAIHVAGTKGKGSTCMMAARLLAACGHRVGLYVSPHLQSLRERIQIHGAPITEELFTELAVRVIAAASEMEKDPKTDAPTFFEILTALAYLAFYETSVTACVIEVGMGGRLDATNVSSLGVIVSGISTISFDHEKILGDNLLSIAAEKAGILRRGVPVVLGHQEESVADFLEKRAKTYGCPSCRVGKEVTVSSNDESLTVPEAPQRITLTTLHGIYPDIGLPVLGDHQQQNAAMAFSLVEFFQTRTGNRPVRLPTVRAAWAGISLPGRMEIVSRKPFVLLDGAHNPASAWALADTISKRFAHETRAMVFAAASDKNIPLMLKILSPLFSTIVLTTIDSPRCMNLVDTEDLLASLAGPETRILTNPDPLKAFADARQAVGTRGLICCAGSLYLAGKLREMFRPFSVDLPDEKS